MNLRKCLFVFAGIGILLQLGCCAQKQICCKPKPKPVCCQCCCVCESDAVVTSDIPEPPAEWNQSPIETYESELPPMPVPENYEPTIDDPPVAVELDNPQVVEEIAAPAAEETNAEEADVIESVPPALHGSSSTPDTTL